VRLMCRQPSGAAWIATLDDCSAMCGSILLGGAVRFYFSKMKSSFLVRKPRTVGIHNGSGLWFTLAMDCCVLTDAQWAKMEPHCLGKPTDPGRSGGDNR